MSCLLTLPRAPRRASGFDEGAVVKEAMSACGIESSSLHTEDGEESFVVDKRMQSAIVITDPDGNIVTRDGRRERHEAWSVGSKTNSVKVKQQLQLLTRRGDADRMPNRGSKAYTSGPEARRLAFSTSPAEATTPSSQARHNSTHQMASHRKPCQSTSKVQPSRARPPISGSKLKRKALEKLFALDDQKLEASQVAQARNVLHIESQERAYTTWLNLVFDRAATNESKYPKFEGFVSQKSTDSPISNCNSPFVDPGLIDRGYLGRVTPSSGKPKVLGNPSRKVLVPLNGVANRGFDRVGIVDSLKKDASRTPDTTLVRQSPTTPYLGSKRLKVFTENEFSSPRDARVRGVCHLTELAQRLKFYFYKAEQEEILAVITQLEKHIDEGRLKMKKDYAVFADMALRKKALRVLLNYNAYWMKIGLHIVLGHTGPLSELKDCDNGPQDAEFVLLESFMERHFLTHAGLTKNLATKKGIEALYRDGFSDALGTAILKRFFLFVLVLDKAKSRTSMRISDGIDGLDGGSPPLFRFDSSVKSSRETLLEFLMDVTHGEGDVIGSLSSLGYHVHYYQSPLADYDFKVVDLIEDLKDGVRLCRLVQLLGANQTFLLEHIQLPTNGRKRHVHNCRIALESLAEAGVPLEDEESCSISAEDIVGGNKDKVFALLWNIIVHLQIPLLVSRPRLTREIAELQGIKEGVALGLNVGTVELLLQWTQITCMISGNLNVRSFRASFADGQALCFIVNLYLPRLLPKNAILRSTSSIAEEHRRMDILNSPMVKEADPRAYQKVVAHNFGLVHDVAQKIGGIPEVLRLSDLLGDTGDNQRNIIIFVAFLCSRLLEGNPLDLHTARQRRNSHLAVDELHRRSPRCLPETDSPNGFNRSYSVPWPQHEAICGTLEPAMYDQTRMNDTPPQILLGAKICKIQALWRAHWARKQFLFQRGAARTIQGGWRAYKSRRLIQTRSAVGCAYHSHVQREEAVHILQRYFRAWAHRKRYLANLSNICKLQAFWWASEARGHFCDERRAVETIEIEWLRYVARRRAVRTPGCSSPSVQDYRQWFYSWSMVIENFHEGVERLQIPRIQACWRGHKARQRFVLQKRAAKTIQDAWRHLLSRRSKRCVSDAEMLTSDAIEIHVPCHSCQTLFVIDQIAADNQLQWRDFSYQEQNLSVMDAASVIQTHCWACLQTKSKLVEASVCKLQAIWRAHKVRGWFVEQRRSAKIIQSAFRLHRSRRLTSLLEVGAILVQKWYRGRIQRRMYVQRKTSALLIQKWYRSTRQRRMYEQQRAAAFLVQSWVRANSQRRRYAQQKAAAILVQKWFRGYSQRRRCAQQNAAATVVQKWYRGNSQRRMYEQSKAAAILIQKWYRGNIERRRYGQRKASAILLQTWYRGSIQRRRYGQQKAATIHLQKWFRGSIQRRKFAQTKAAAIFLQKWYRAKIQKRTYAQQKAAAICIQMWFRGSIQRRRNAEQDGAATLVQKWYRGTTQRRTYTQKKAAAVLLQRWCRGAIQRRRYAQQRAAAVLLQKWYRGAIQRQRYAQQKAVAVLLQKCYRGAIQRQRYAQQRAAAVILQKWYRGAIQRQRYAQQRAAAVLLQKWCRGAIQRRRYTQQRAAAVLLQKWYRGAIQRRRYAQQRAAAGLLQKWYRGAIERQRYAEQRAAVVLLQKFYRGAIQRRRYAQQRAAAILLQKWLRGSIQRQTYLLQKAAAIRLQNWYTGNIQRRRYLQQKAAAMLVQKWYRGNLQRRSYVQQKAAATLVQKWLRGSIQRQTYLLQKAAAIRLQNWYRGNIQRRRYLQQKAAAMLVQKWYKGNRQKRSYARQKAAATIIQTWHRASIRRRVFVQHKVAVRIIQAHIKGWIQKKAFRGCIAKITTVQAMWRARSARHQFLASKTAIRKIQRAWRQNSARKAALELLRWRIEACKGLARIQAFARGMLQRCRYRTQKKAAIRIQSAFRAWHANRASRRRELFVNLEFGSKVQFHVEGEIGSFEVACKLQACYEELELHDCVEVQESEDAKRKPSAESHSSPYDRRVNEGACLVVEESLKDEISCNAAQANAPASARFISRPEWAVVTIQRYFRGCISRRAFLRKKRSAIRLQAHWRGFVCRRGARSQDDLRQLIQGTGGTAEDSKRLCTRLTEVLALLLREKTISGILTICRTLDVATLHSASCCERLVEAGAITVFLKLIERINRSTPHEPVLKHALSVLTNLAEHPPFASRIAESPSAVRIIGQQLYMFRNKEEIVAQAMSVLQLVCRTPAGVQVLQRERAFCRRFHAMASSLDRKTQVERRKVPQSPTVSTPQHVKSESARKRIGEANFMFLSLLKT